jgi:hypothetical protein
MKWIKIWPLETFHGTTFQELNAEERGVWFSLLVMAGLPPREGIIELRKGVGYEPAQLAGLLQVDEDTLLEVLRKLIRLQKLVTVPRKSPEFPRKLRLKIRNWRKYQTEYARYRKGRTSKEFRAGYTSKDSSLDACPGQSKSESENKSESKKNTPLWKWVRQLVTRWNTEIASRYSQVAPVRLRTNGPPLATARIRHLRQRFEERDFTANIDRIFEKIHRSPGLTTRTPSWDWVISFDFLIANDSNYMKILEGKYERRGKYSDIGVTDG